MSFDVNGDPIQHGLDEFSVEDAGVTLMNGKCLGIVLSVHHANSDDNLLYRFLRSNTGGDEQASHLEATVLLVFGGTEMNIVLDNVIILPMGKCSSTGMTKGEPADWTEEVPEGCTTKEIEELFAASGRGGIENLSGDWVVVDFIGGLLQLPIITQWFSSPRNLKDAATVDVGKRFVIRRNNSELAINKNGDLHLTHRVGQYLQMRGSTITLKHREGQVLHLDESGGASLVSGVGDFITMDDDGITITTETTTIELRENKIRIAALEGLFSLQNTFTDVLTGGFEIHTGNGGKSLANEDLLPQVQKLAEEVQSMNIALITFFAELATIFTAISAIVSPLVPFKAFLEALLKDLTEVGIGVGPVVTSLKSWTTTMVTKILRSE